MVVFFSDFFFAHFVLVLFYFVLFSSLILAFPEVWQSKIPARFDDISWTYPQCFSKGRGQLHPRCVLSVCSLGDEQLLDKSCLDKAAGLAEQQPTADLDPWGASLHTAPGRGELTCPLPLSPMAWLPVLGDKWLFFTP